MKSKECKLIISKIKGYELKIVQIIEKWKVSDYDQSRIIDLMAQIEIETNNLVLQKQKDERYKKLMGEEK